MTVVVATLGSKGDLHPFLAIARALVERGQDVLLLSQEAHRVEVEAQGVRFEAVATERDHRRTMSHPDLWHPIRGFGVLWRHLAVPAILPTVAVLERLSAASSRPLQVLVSPLAVGARLAADTLPIRLTTAHTAPSGLRSVSEPMFIGGWHVPRWLPAPVKRGLWRTLDAYKLDPMAAPALNRWRLEHHLDPIETSIFGDWLHARGDVIGLFPGDFGPQSPDWPAPLEQYGFPLYESGDAEHDAELEAFCARDGQPLVVFYPGSTVTSQQTLMRAAASLLLRHQIRILWLQSEPGADTATDSPSWLTRPAVHLPTVLRQASAFVHHGGIGAIAQGLARGVHQIVQPAAYDQFENRWRLHQVVDPYRRLSKRARNPQELASEVRRRIGLEYPRDLLPPLRYSLPSDPNPAVAAIVDRLIGTAGPGAR